MERTNRDGFVALDNISNQGINLQRALHRESELCKKLHKLLQDVIVEISSSQDNIKVHQENIKTAIERQRLVGNNLDGLNDSLSLMEKVRCDYKNQLILEKIKTEEQRVHLDSIIRKFDSIWQNYEKIYYTFPMASERESLQKYVNELRTSYFKKKQLLIQEERKVEQMKHMRCLQMQVKIIYFSKIYIQHSSTIKLYTLLQEEVIKIELEIKKLNMECLEGEVKLPVNKNYDIRINKSVNHIETMNNVLTTKDFVPASSTVTKEPILHKKGITKYLYDDIELTAYDVLEIPQLKLPVFNSPPRKLRNSSQSILMQVNFTLELQNKATNYLIKENRISNAQCPLRNEMISTITDENQYEKMEEDNGETLEELENVCETEQMQQCSIQKSTELNDSMKEISPSQESNPSSGASDDDTNSEKYRKSYINHLKQAPEFSYFSRENVKNSEQVERSTRVDDMRSQYFMSTYARAEVTQEVEHESNQVEMVNALQVPENETFRPSTHTDNISSNTAQKDASVNYDDLQLMQFDSPSPPEHERGHRDILNTTYLDQSNDSQGNDFTLNFAPQTSNNIASLFGNASEQSSEQDDSFNFTFGNETKASNVLKLF